MILLQIALSVIYGILIEIDNRTLSITSIIDMIFLALLIVAGIHLNNKGFGLIFGYTKQLSWSGIGFNLLITALAL